MQQLGLEIKVIETGISGRIITSWFTEGQIHKNCFSALLNP
jgi:hypothetical protein